MTGPLTKSGAIINFFRLENQLGKSCRGVLLRQGACHISDEPFVMGLQTMRMEWGKGYYERLSLYDGCAINEP